MLIMYHSPLQSVTVSLSPCVTCVTTPYEVPAPARTFTRRALTVPWRGLEGSAVGSGVGTTPLASARPSVTVCEAVRPSARVAVNRTPYRPGLRGEVGLS